MTSEYTYDVGNRLVIAKTTAPEATQLRYFNDDNRGFLNTEIPPEKGARKATPAAPPAGTLAGSKTGSGDLNDLSFFYDRAGRLTSIW